MNPFSSSLATVTALTLACASSLYATDAQAWGKTGHRITGKIAESYLSEDARAAITALLGPESLAEASTYADEMRSNPSEFWQETANPFHYVTLNEPHNYHAEDCPPQGDAMSALTEFTATLQDPQASRDEKQLALRFIVHIIGDLHQPLHVGSAALADRGGNDVKVVFFGEQSNLHRVWDSGLVDHQQLSYSEFSHWLQRKISVQQAASWATPDPYTWISESSKLRDEVYPETDEPYLGWDYVYNYTPVMKTRLQQGGVRIAAYLNHVFAKGQS
ncbi:S1/P1 nuclease [Pseudidiomarina sp. 1APP75-32.1]|uniref:S1/P1 nuclease n=1 Tax=Pseudidiomarina terrestris TaxID=2820060 RepID=A0AAW7QYU0_9GAMM|nr:MULTISPECIES: S1/P1 nuclease [unclassified Pseudidiomarina]MDN7123902.1 S1/P1 nuclease [Pseudidiomarina sp. 1APP75-32.1]MDN7138758.1 S1/P1 nuclease [Pseudidiomarina sp. 1ASP75-14]MEA3588779.1 S1/P1 nuclease [Pseudidiomarina sp. 1APP75-27a]